MVFQSSLYEISAVRNRKTGKGDGSLLVYQGKKQGKDNTSGLLYVAFSGHKLDKRNLVSF